MIKLIASDLDGTLFKPHGVLPDETFNLIERLYEKGITFAPASGRQLPNLLQIFKPVLDKIAIIAENGGVAKSFTAILCLNAKLSARLTR